ncbi:MAG: hypothetical protein ACREFS_08140, partial [Acetobacteraceae bacterium]
LRIAKSAVAPVLARPDIVHARPTASESAPSRRGDGHWTPVGPALSTTLERIALESNRGAIPGDNGERVDPLGQTKESVFRQPEHAPAANEVTFLALMRHATLTASARGWSGTGRAELAIFGVRRGQTLLLALAFVVAGCAAQFASQSEIDAAAKPWTEWVMPAMTRLDDGHSDPVSIAYGIEPVRSAEYAGLSQAMLKGHQTFEGLMAMQDRLSNME